MQHISTIVTKIHAIISGPDTRFTYFQAPVKVQDVVGRVFPFPSECSVAALNVEIAVRFNKGPGRKEVQAGDYEIFDARNSEHLLTATKNSEFIPGMSVVMAVVVRKTDVSEDECPNPHCRSVSFRKPCAGGRAWYVPPPFAHSSD